MSPETKIILLMCTGWAAVYFVSVFWGKKGTRMARAKGGITAAAVVFVVMLVSFKGCAYFITPIDGQSLECERLPGPYGC